MRSLRANRTRTLSPADRGCVAPAFNSPEPLAPMRRDIGLSPDAYASGLVDATKKRRIGHLRKPFVDGLARTGPVAVIIDNNDAASLESRVKVCQLVLGRFVPIGVETEQ